MMIGLAAPQGEALAQFIPPGPPVAAPPPFQTLPPVADEELPPYDPPPGYRSSGPYGGPPQTYEQEALPPPGPYGRANPDYAPNPGYGPGPAPRPQYGSMPPQQDDGLRPPAPIGPGQQQAAIDPDVTSRLPQDDRPETGPIRELPPQFRRTTVNYPTREPAGTIIIDTPNTYLYLVLGNGRAMRYGIGVGREGFTWAGTERVTRMAEWPDWHPPPEMIERQPYLPRFMAGGPGNPLGARALYLGRTIYRIHGTNQPSTIGTFVSSGCIRLTNDDVMDLYYRVKVGTRVVVLPGRAPATASAAQPGSHPVPSGPQTEAYDGEPIPLQPPGVIRAH
jgi:lipoprotein-anchoring transpeptidase ErfK/SrfK